jgi:carbamoyltransferase
VLGGFLAVNVLGISAFYHDSAACLVVDGAIVAAAQEERFTRIRHDPSFPFNAIQACLDKAKIGAADLDMVVFYEKPLIKFERVLQSSVNVAPRGVGPFCKAMPSWFADKLVLPRILKREIQYKGPVLYTSHHLSHAASAFYPSPFSEAAILTVDGVGEWTTSSIAAGVDNQIELIKEIRFPHSIGLLYSAFTEFLGFKVNSDEYKVMGLAPYGNPVYVGKILDDMVAVDDDGGFELNMDWFSFQYGERTTSKKFHGFCRARAPESKLEQVHMDLARSIQEVTEIILVRQAAYAGRLTGYKNLCLAGGVALNCVANGKILASGNFGDIWIQPAAGDAGGALGAALVGWYSTGAARQPSEHDSMNGALLGPSFHDSEIQAELEAAGLPYEKLGENIDQAVANCLDLGQVVGRYVGAMEFGPRALGNRSILADPRNPTMQRVVNEKIKFREGFRPFAPAVLREHVADWFDLDRSSPYMLLVTQVAQKRLLPAPEVEPEGLGKLGVLRSDIPAVTHVDGSARIQTVDIQNQPDFQSLIQAFHSKTNCPVVLNTSFNLRGQPIVCTPKDAVQTFLACDIDVLAAGPFLAKKPDDWTRQKLPKPKPFRRPRRVGELRRFGIETAVLFTLVGLVAWFLPKTPSMVLAAGSWLFASFGLLMGLLFPRGLRGFENRLSQFGAKANSFVGYLLFGAVFILVLLPTSIIRRLTGKGPEPGYWQDVAKMDSDLENMF